MPWVSPAHRRGMVREGQGVGDQAPPSRVPGQGPRGPCRPSGTGPYATTDQKAPGVACKGDPSRVLGVHLTWHGRPICVGDGDAMPPPPPPKRLLSLKTSHQIRIQNGSNTGVWGVGAGGGGGGQHGNGGWISHSMPPPPPPPKGHCFVPLLVTDTRSHTAQ